MAWQKFTPVLKVRPRRCGGELRLGRCEVGTGSGCRGAARRRLSVAEELLPIIRLAQQCVLLCQQAGRCRPTTESAHLADPPPPPAAPPQEIEQRGVQPELYPYGSRGPVGAHYLAAKHGVRWGDLGDDE